MQTKLRAALAVIVILALVGCSTGTVITNLQTALDAISAVIPILGTITGVPVDDVSAAETYVQAANQALGQASTILAGSGTDASKAAQIAAAFAGIAAPVVPAQYANIVALVQTVAGDVAQFLASVPATSTAAANAIATGGHTTKWSDADRARLARATVTANANAAKCQTMWPHAAPAVKSAACQPIASGYTCTVTFTAPTIREEAVTFLMADGMPRAYRVEAGVTSAQFAVQTITASPTERAVMVVYRRARMAIQ